MRSSTVLSAALLASGAVAAPIAYGTVNDQDISIRDNFAEASHHGITDEPNTLDRRQKIPIVHNPIPPKLPGPQPAQPHKIPVEKGDKTPKIKPEDLERRQTNIILHNAIQAAKVGKNHVQHQVQEEMKLPAQGNYHPPKFPGKAPVPELPAGHSNPLEGWHTRRDAQPEELERRQGNTIVHNAIQAAKVGKNRLQHQIKQEMKVPAQSNVQLPKFPGPAPVPVPQNPVRHKNPFEGWHARRDAQPEDDMSEGTLE